MMSNFSYFRRVASAGCVIATILLPSTAGAAEMEKVLHVFQGGNDGDGASGNLIMDKSGNLYGATVYGGGGNDCRENSYGCGTIYLIAPDRSEKVLHAFAGGCDGAFPSAGLVADKAGNMYGMTVGGGVCNSDTGFGTVYEITPDGAETVLYAFQSSSGGNYPQANLTIDGKGNLYGTTAFGGNMEVCGGNGCGTVFKVTPKGRESVLYTFQGGSDGADPWKAGVIMDKAGNLYGTTLVGGGSGCGGSGCGTVYKLAPDGTETILYAFQGYPDGEIPISGVVADDAGNLYGTTTAGGASDQGIVFKVTLDGTESILYPFQGGTDGAGPDAGVIIDKAGNLYGTTYDGGDPKCHDGRCGVVYEVAPDGTETVLHKFDQNHFGRNPNAGLLLGKHDILYGTTSRGGHQANGVVFELKK